MKFLIKDSNKIDLHIHTNFSDGREYPINILRRAQKEGLEYISFTDHNVDAARFDFDKYESNEKNKVKIIPGCEVSAMINGKKIHLLAYNYNILFVKLFLPKLRKASEDKKYLSIKKVSSFIHFCGGKVFLAHPFKYKFDGKEMVEEVLKSKCIDGIECIHSYHTQEEIDYLLNICEKNDLIVSAGSDFHYNNKKIRSDILQKEIFELPVSNTTIEEQLVRAKQQYNSVKKR